MFAYTIIYYIYRWNDETTCTQRREIVLCKLLCIYFFANLLWMTCGIDWIQNWYSNFFFKYKIATLYVQIVCRQSSTGRKRSRVEKSFRINEAIFILLYISPKEKSNFILNTDFQRRSITCVCLFKIYRV